MKITHIMAIFSIFLLASCTTASRGGIGAAGGAGAGAIAGQAIGHDTQSTLLGAAIGGVLGYIVGNEMDKFDQQQLSQAYESAPSGQPTTWVNPDHGNQYQVIPQPAYQMPGSNKICRKAEIIAVINGRSQKTYSTACRDMNGNWQLQQ
ncbi:MAG: glycine zipper 2TM domain-containing protein [Candidatus Electrothrix sp. AR3]|nr:glycine zipper 2TM domain-containing protein [Candidatus Electrothrix sp. AR3]